MSVRIGTVQGKKYATSGIEGPKFYFEKGNLQAKAIAIGQAYEWHRSQNAFTSSSPSIETTHDK